MDALTELVNLGVSRAAVSLREMVGEQVLLSVPTLVLVSSAGAVEILEEREDRELVAVLQTFEGDIAGRAMLIFPESKSLELVRAVAGGDLTFEDIIELEQEALSETGNIILNSCLATIANMLQLSLKMSLPEIFRGDGTELFRAGPVFQPNDVVMFLYIDFAIRERDIRGYIAMLMDMPSLAALQGLIADFIERTVGASS